MNRIISISREYGSAGRTIGQKLAEKLGINVNTFIGYETAGREPKFETLIKIADFFGVSTDELLKPRSNDTANKNACDVTVPCSLSIGNFTYKFELPQNQLKNQLKNH